MRENCRQRGRKSKAIGQHVFRAGLAQLLAEPVIPVQHLPDDGFSVGRVDVTLFHGRSRRKPPSFIYVFLQPGEVGGKIFLHEAITIGAAEVEDIMRIFIDESEIVFHRLANIFVDDLGILPSPFRIEVGIADHVKGWLLAQIRLLGCLCRGHGEQHQAGKLNRHQQRAESSHRNSPNVILKTCLVSARKPARVRLYGGS